MPKRKLEPDVLVLGDHPSAYLAAALLREGAAAPLRVCHAKIPGEAMPDRLCTINPALFDLHKLLAPLRKKLELTPVHGVKFLADDPNVRSEWTGKSPAAFVTTFKQVHAALAQVAADSGAEFFDPDDLRLVQVHESGVEVVLDGKTIRPRLILLAGTLPPPQRRVLGLPDTWDSGVVHRYTFLKLKGGKWVPPESKPSIRMSLDLRGTLAWAWMTPGHGCVQVAVEQPLEQINGAPPSKMLSHWIDVLVRHGQLNADAGPIDAGAAQSLDLPLAGALAQEGVANRTLLLGPAGGFFSACAEDIYPNCWSAVYAAEAARKALKEHHVQDALHVYRQKWGATLGDFLRGPQQNLRFLLPLVYRNPAMTARLAEAILLGKSVVR